MYNGFAMNCSFVGNSAKRDGGAICGDESSARNSIFINNSACNGGAIYESSVKNCYFNGNNASENGGAMWGGYAASCNFTNNHANSYVEQFIMLKS